MAMVVQPCSCGGAAHLVPHDQPNPSTYGHYVYCVECKRQGPVRYGGAVQAIRDWNTDQTLIRRGRGMDENGDRD